MRCTSRVARCLARPSPCSTASLPAFSFASSSSSSIRACAVGAHSRCSSSRAVLPCASSWSSSSIPSSSSLPSARVAAAARFFSSLSSPPPPPSPPPPKAPTPFTSSRHQDLERALYRDIASFPVHLPIEEAWTPPASWYTSPEFFELEKRKVFPNSWSYVGTSAQLPNAGDFFTGDQVGEPYVIVRGKDGKLRAFFNVCRHHANILVPGGSGNTKSNTFTCCYHGWQYGTDGRLLKATLLKGIKDFRPKDFGLIEIPLEEWCGLIFIHMGAVGENRDPASKLSSLPDLHKELAPLKTLLDTQFGDISKLKFVRRVEFDLKCNWKVVNDNYLDGIYHIPYVHQGLGSALDMSSYRYENTPLYILQCAAGNKKSENKSSEDVPVGGDFVDRVGAGAVYAMFHPTFAINRYGRVMDLNLVIPLGVDRTKLIFDYYFEPEIADAQDAQTKDFIEKSIAASIRVQDEDTAVCESLQRGLSSMAYNRGRYAPTQEIGTYHFHKQVAEDYRRGLTFP